MHTPNGRPPSRDVIIAEQISKWWFATLSEGAFDGGAHRSLLRNGADAVVVTSDLLQSFVQRFSSALEAEEHLKDIPLTFREFEVLLPWMRALALLRQDGGRTAPLARVLADIKQSYTSARLETLLASESQEAFCEAFARLVPMMGRPLSVRDATRVYLGWRDMRQRQRLAYDVLMAFSAPAADQAEPSLS